MQIRYLIKVRLLLFLALFISSISVTAVLGDELKNEFLADEKELSKYVKKNALPISWSQILGEEIKVVYIGEAHPSNEIRKELIREMKTLKAQGITHLALEMLSDDYSAAIGKYCCDGSCQKEIKRGLDRFGWDPNSYLEVIDAAKVEGIKVLAIDMEAKEKDAYKKKIEQAKNEVRTERDDFYEMLEKQCKVEKEFFDSRDARMAKNIFEVVKKDSKARVLVLIGAHHVQKEKQPKQLLEKHGIESKSVATVTGEFSIIKSLKNAGLRDSSVFIPTPKAKAGVDGFINIPWWNSVPPVEPAKIRTHAN